MSLIREKSYTSNAFVANNDALKQIAEDWGMPFEVDADTDTAGRIYLDKEKDIFLYSNNSLNFWLCHTANSKINIAYKTFAANYFYTDCNADKTVLYLRAAYSSELSRNGGFILAKDKSGDWACITKNSIITKDGSFSFTTTSAFVNTNFLYSAFNAPNAVNGMMFEGLYRVFTAQTFSVSGSYVNFGGKIFRTVDSLGGVMGAPDYAFEARQE